MTTQRQAKQNLCMVQPTYHCHHGQLARVWLDGQQHLHSPYVVGLLLGLWWLLLCHGATSPSLFSGKDLLDTISLKQKGEIICPYSLLERHEGIKLKLQTSNNT